ncbi:MAG: PKD domain-containing protein, partial [Flavobacteriia bacterium]|nr:PKD domain-containing protein [Flavobacteriia bacterium]
LGTYDFTQVNVFLDADFDPGATPVWNTMNVSQGMIDNGMGNLHVYQAAENPASAFWALAFPGISFDPDVPGVYDLRVRLESTYSGEPLVTLAIQVVVEGITYYSQATGNMSDPIWDVVPAGTAGAATFSGTTNVVIQNGHTVTNTGSEAVRDLTVEAGGSLALDAASFLTVHGDEAIFDGSLTAGDNSTLALAGADATILESTGGPLSLWNLTVNTPQGTLTDATISIRGTLQLDGGDFDATMANITLASTASGTGRLGAVAATADYLGNLTVQRYIPAGHTNWRMLGSAVAGQTIQNWKDDFLTAGFPGSHYPPFDDPVGSGILWPSIRWYDETVVSTDPDDGVVGVSSNTQPLSVGQGFLAWSGDNLTSTTAFTVDVTGVPTIAQSPVTLPMSFTSSGDVNADGWNLVGNPLPSPIDFEAISRGNDVRNAYWIFDPVAGNNKAWTGGIGQGSLNGKIQSSQGFWVKADGTDLTTTVDEGAKVNLPTGGTFGGSQNAVLPVLSLHLASGLNTYSDEATIVFANGSPAYGGNDALKMTFKTVGAPQVGVRSSGGELLSVDFFGTYNEAIQIPLDVDVDVTGTYTITAALAGFNSLGCLTLVDQLTGTVTPLTDGASYTFSITAGDEGNASRFVINGTKPVALYVDHAPCFGQDGAGGVISNEGPIDLVWTDAFGNTLLHQGMENSSGDYFQFNAPAGNYMVYMSPAGACGQVSASFTITEPPAIGSSVTTTATTCPNGDDGTAAVSATGGTAPYGFLWSNGATTTEITGPAGAYTVTVTDANGCMLPLDVTVPAGEGAIAGFALNGEAVAGVPMVFSNTSVLADQYFWDFGDGQTSTEEAPAHTWALPGEYTVALTASDEVCSDTFTMTVIVGIGTGIGGNDGGDLHVWATPDHIVIAHPFGSAPMDVDVHDATGRLVLSRTAISKPDRIALDDRKLSTGVWFVRVTSGKTQRTFRVPLVR